MFSLPSWWGRVLQLWLVHWVRWWYWLILHAFLSSAVFFFFKINFFEKLRNTTIDPDLSPNYLQSLTAHSISRKRVNLWFIYWGYGLIFKSLIEGAQWLRGRVLDLRPRGRGFKPCQHHCVVSSSKTHFSLLSTGSTQEGSSRHNRKFVDWDVRNFDWFINWTLTDSLSWWFKAHLSSL